MLTILAVAQSQDYTTINVTIPGTLKSILDARVDKFIFYLKITGNIDARDIKCLRDDNPALAFLDLSEATINEYYGNGGTSIYQTSYPANELPEFSFSNYAKPRGSSPIVKLKLPNTITTINRRAFYYCSALTDIAFGDSITYIGTESFLACDGLKSLIIPNTVKFISDSAFSRCNGLTDLTIMSSDTYFDHKAFFYCKYIKTITCLGIIPPVFGDESFSYLNSLTTVYVPAASVAAYKASKWGTLFFSRIKANPTDDITGITSGVKVYASRSEIIVEGTAPKEIITLYSIMGKQLKIVVSSGERLNIPVDKQGIYLVKIGGKTYKVVV